VLQLDAVSRQAGSLERVDHRPWRLPATPWIMGQTWLDLLFAHWRVPPSELDPHIPEGLEVELHDGSAWLGITPFRLEALRLRGLPPLPGVSSFFEVNVRTYVRATDGKPGIWFFSLDASSRLAVEAARRSYKLPYFQARTSMRHHGEEIDYQSRRIGDDRRMFSGRYSPEGATFNADPGSLEWFLTERYCHYGSDELGRLVRAEIHHKPWLLQPADARIERTSLAHIELQRNALCHFASRQDVVIWPLEHVPD
jgi:uncharacterized protein YqjF (DUF2071 family)